MVLGRSYTLLDTIAANINNARLSDEEFRGFMLSNLANNTLITASEFKKQCQIIIQNDPGLMEMLSSDTLDEDGAYRDFVLNYWGNAQVMNASDYRKYTKEAFLKDDYLKEITERKYS